MIAALVEAALRSLFVALAVGSGLLVFRVRNVLAQKTAWGMVLAAAVFMPLLLPLAARWQFDPANARFVLPANPQTLLEELQARIQSRSSAAKSAARLASPAGPPLRTPIRRKVKNQRPLRTNHPPVTAPMQLLSQIL